MAYEPIIRLIAFAGVLLLMLVLEALLPRRELTAARGPRWLSNLGLVGINTLVARIIAPVGAIGVADFAAERGWGVLRLVETHDWLAIALAFIALDFVIWLQHVMFHAVPALWRLHKVHHADLDVDATTGVRFHPIEIILSLGIKIAAILFLGAPALAVLIFEIALNATSMFNHANVRLPGWLDWMLRLFVVTPDMHRIHHSIDVGETNSNYGFNLPWWDYLFGTYIAAPQAGHEHMTLGLAEWRDVRVGWLHWMLALPFFGRSLPGETRTPHASS